MCDIMRFRENQTSEFKPCNLNYLINLVETEIFTSYIGGTDELTDALLISSKEGRVMTLHFDDESECLIFEASIKADVENFEPRHYIREDTSIRIWASDKKRLDLLKHNHKSYASVLNMVLNEYIYNHRNDFIFDEE